MHIMLRGFGLSVMVAAWCANIYICRPAVVDWDGDGGLDLIVGAEDEPAKQV